MFVKGLSKFFPFVLLIFITVLIFSPGISTASWISARAAILIDGNAGKVLYAKQPDLRLPPASTIKLVTAMVVLDSLEPDTIVTVSPKAVSASSVRFQLSVGQKLFVRDLLALALIESVNSAAVTLAEAVAGSEKAFVVMMNRKVRGLGAMNTRFINASGLPGKKQYTTARDLAKIMEESLKYPLIKEIISTRVKIFNGSNNEIVLLKNTNYMLWTDDGHIGGKTGYTRSARHCFVGASRKGDKTLIIALLGEPVRKKLWLDAEKLLEKGREVLINSI